MRADEECQDRRFRETCGRNSRSCPAGAGRRERRPPDPTRRRAGSREPALLGPASKDPDVRLAFERPAL